MRSFTLILGLLGVITLAPACNTDPLWEPEQKVEGATTDLANPEGIDLPETRFAGLQECDLVEQTLTHRAMYVRSLQALHDYYRDHGYETKRLLAAHELEDVRRIKPFRYIRSAEVPSDDLRPTESIPAADELYEEGLTLVHDGGHGLPFLYRENKLRQALATFRELIEKYPTSDKIDDAAFYCGEIHKEYFNEDRLAVRWYERAFTWDPATPHPARFQAAVVCDYRLHDRDRALELYHQVLEHETFNRSNCRWAVNRIDQLTRELRPKVSLSDTQEPPVGESPAPASP